MSLILAEFIYILYIIFCILQYKSSFHYGISLAFILIFTTLTGVNYFFIFHSMSRISLVATIAIFMSMVSSAVFADSGTTDTLPISPAVSMTPSPLLLDTVGASDINTIVLTLNQPIRYDSVRVRIVDQATNESIKIATITGSTVTTSSATIVTASNLSAGASYIVTITSALSLTDMTIKAGVDSIREFTTSATLSGSSLSAPPNPSAVIVATGSTTVVVPVAPPVVATGVVTPIPQDTDALPQTGAPTIILILLAGIASFGLLMFRKRA